MSTKWMITACIGLFAGFMISACGSTQKSESLSFPLAGVWRVEQFASRYPDSTWSFRTPPYESLYIFTRTHYSYAYVIGSSPRKLFSGDPNKPSDIEKVSAYDSFVANSGTYTWRNDSTLILTAILHKNPNEMTKTPLTYKIKVEDNKLEMTVYNPSFLPGREWRTSLVRIE